MAFDPHYSFALVDKDTGKIYGLLNTIPLPVGPEKIAKHFPTYKSVEKTAMKEKKTKKLKTILCFSIVAAPNTRVRTRWKIVSCSRYMINKMRKKFANKTIAVYTRLSSVPKDMSASEYYKKNKDDLTKLGSVGMHSHLGASLPPVAIIENARPEDLSGAKANVVMLYE